MNLTYDQFVLIQNVALILAGIFFLIAIILFFALKIPAVIGDLSGATARKAIENIRNQNESTGDKGHSSSTVNMERGKLTDKISESGRIMHAPSDKLGVGMKTEKISTQRLDDDPNQTTVLYSGGNETTVLSDINMGAGETTVLNEHAGETTLLSDANWGETSKLAEETTGIQAAPVMYIFEIERDITFIHSQEVIV